jgi:hypothetical protein
MRIASWNIEWMNNWFVGYNQVAFRSDHHSSGITDVDDLCRRVAGVIKSLDPDVLAVEEGPSDINEMRLFVDRYLADQSGIGIFDVFGGFDGSTQKIYMLVKKQGAFINAAAPNDSLTEGLEDSWETDVNGDFYLEDYKFTRRPLVVEGKTAPNNNTMRIIALHTKSKYVQYGKSWWNNPDKKQDYVVKALENRRRISSEAMRLRMYLDDTLKQINDARVVVLGDFNDGPGIDYFERHYLTHNVTDILIGSTYYSDLLFKHAVIGRVPKSDLYTAIFDDFIDEIDDRPILLDHILVSPALAPEVTNAGIAHTEYDAATDASASVRQKDASDHRPIYIDL